MYGEETKSNTIEEEAPILQPTKTKKQKNKKNKKQKVANNGGDSSNKQNDKASSNDNASPDVISVDMDVLYDVTISPAVEVTETRKELDFKTQEDVKYYYNQALLKVRGKDFETAAKLLTKSIKKEHLTNYRLTYFIDFIIFLLL